jgi:hypothetical protein
VAREFAEGGTLKLTDNAWKAIQTGPLAVDANTVLTFELRTDVEGELQGIGLGASDALDANLLYQLAGVQSFTRQSENGAYTAGDGWQSFEIAVGADIPGTYDRVVLMADDDRPGAPSDTYFRDITLTGLGAGDTTLEVL